MPFAAACRLTGSVLALLWLTACNRSTEVASSVKPASNEAPTIQPAPVLLGEDAKDIHSYAQPAVARVTNVDLDLVADFSAHRFSGAATLTIDAPSASSEVVLDTKHLEIQGVTSAQGEKLNYQLGKRDDILGTPLTIQLNGARKVIVRYATDPEALSLQWLTPEQTAGGKQPYLFSQGESILTRSWIPTQDSPGIRQTWSARIVAPADLHVVMSAEMLTPDGEPAANGTRAWRFRMEKPVPTYLIAVAIGDISSRSLGPRTGVYTEPAMLDRVATEFVDLEKMVDAAENLYGPYRWGRYDLLVLPPSFPFGGMENPRLTFATPTIIAGDRSLVSVVAHELAHSWSGNLVTNATWADFWLNEGFTTYFENRIMERLYGKDVADMLADLGWDELQEQIREAGGPKNPDTRLHLDLAGRDPDDATNPIGYEKGATFLRTIEYAVGRERWDAYLRSYFDRHAFQPQTTARLLTDLRANLFANDEATASKIGLEQWVYEPGLPENAVHVHSAALTKIDERAKAFAQAKSNDSLKAADTAAWTSYERVRFLNDLPRKLSTGKLAELDRELSLSTQGNSEVQFAWLKLAIANRYDPAVPSLEKFLTSMGRRKFVAPLFTALVAQDQWGKPIAQRIYSQARPGYHSVTRGTVDRIVNYRSP
jgi:aminopeptidase N